jgi:hypothetical protein
LQKAWTPGLSKFIFTIDFEGQSRRVCEGALIALLGYGTTDLSECPRQWRDVKREVMNGSVHATQELRAEGHERAAPQFDHCKAFISDFMFECDAMPTAGNEHVKVVPFISVSQFHDEFESHWKMSNGEGEDSDIPSYSTFKLAYDSFGTDIRLMRCKGNFSTCELCINAAELLRKRRYSKAERQLILDYRMMHLKQQARQRDALEEEKLRSADLDKYGQPIQCLIFSDAITTTRGDTPNWGKFKSKGDDGAPTTENRTIGVEVYCGPIKTIFLYHTDEFGMGHGANIMIEVQRQTLKDLADLLKDEGMAMPKKAHFQFDNSGENKVSRIIPGTLSFRHFFSHGFPLFFSFISFLHPFIPALTLMPRLHLQNKEMLFYCSLLVELNLFDEITLGFLIVGHTHSTIDQFFSVLCKAIDSCFFIGSPMALHELYSKCCNDFRMIPKKQRTIHVAYDYVKAFKPYINKGVKYYQVPHCFFFRYYM